MKCFNCHSEFHPTFSNPICQHCGYYGMVKLSVTAKDMQVFANRVIKRNNISHQEILQVGLQGHHGLYERCDR
jgi:DNA-directed RNA polymerase subunit RPC12/RpoP